VVGVNMAQDDRRPGVAWSRAGSVPAGEVGPVRDLDRAVGRAAERFQGGGDLDLGDAEPYRDRGHELFNG
jgi:hypothetical protein